MPLTPRLILSASVFSALGALPFNIFPLFLSTIADRFVFDNEQLGLVGTAYLVGSAIVAVSAIYWLARVPWQLAVAGSLGLIILCVFGFGFVGGAYGIFLLVAVFGGANCVLFTIALTVLSTHSNPDRAFGIKLCSEMALASIVLFAMTTLIMSSFGFWGFVFGLIVFYAASVPALSKMPSASELRLRPSSNHLLSRLMSSKSKPAWIASTALFIQFAVMSGVWGFAERIGSASGLHGEAIGTVLTLSPIAGLVAGLSAVVLGARFGQLPPLTGALIAAIISIAAFSLEKNIVVYALGIFLFVASLQIFAVYQMGLITSVDPDLTFVTLIPFVLATSGAIGPAVAGKLASDGSFEAVYVIAAILSLLAIALNLAVGYLKKSLAKSTINMPSGSRPLYSEASSTKRHN